MTFSYQEKEARTGATALARSTSRRAEMRRDWSLCAYQAPMPMHTAQKASTVSAVRVCIAYAAFGFLRSTDQFTSGRRASQRTPVIASMSGHASAGTLSFFQRDMDALDTLRPRAERSSARRDDPWAASHARSSGDLAKVSISVSENYTPLFSDAKLLSGNKAELPYAAPMGFKERLREAREAAELTGTSLGAKLAVSKATISHWENGRYEPNLEQLTALCDELEVSADWMLGRETTTLSAEALQEARAYQGLSDDARRKWRAMRLTMFSTA